MGSLNERNPSLWVATSPQGGFPALEGDRGVEVAVIGAGIAGLTSALLLAEEGVEVGVVEAGPVAAGATGYTTAKLTSLHGLTYAGLARHKGPEAARAYGQANQAGLDLVRRWVEERGIDCDFERQAAYTYTEAAERVPEVEAEVEAARQAGLPAHLTSETSLPYPVQAAVRVEDQAQFHPRRYCLALARAVQDSGGWVWQDTRATGVDQGSPCTVRTQRGTLRAERVLVTTQLPFLDRGLFFARCHPVRSYVLAARLEGAVPEGMYLSADTPTRSVRSAQRGALALLGGESHKVGQDPDTTRRYGALEAWSRERFSVASVEHRWSAQDYMPVDGVPYVGRLVPGRDRVLVATGFMKWGMTNGTAAAMMLADAVLGRDNPWARLFDASRVRAPLSSRELVKENADVGSRFFADRIASRHPPGADRLGPGEGGIVTDGGRKVAAYRDDGGALHAVSPVCTHLKCEVRFNTAERTWDCPCHGSRFDCDGRVLQGPAVKDLETR